MGLVLKQLTLGPWEMNGYVVICKETQTSTIIDPGEDADKILDAVKDTQVAAILITHGHQDHVGALDEVKQTTQAPVYMHKADADNFDLEYDIEVKDGDKIQIGNQTISVIHTPGHTPGQVCYNLNDRRILVGDTVFVGGPGKTWSPEDFSTTMWTMQQIVFEWPDETEFFPGHGPSGTIGKERPAFSAFVDRGWPEDLQGDVTWNQ